MNYGVYCQNTGRVRKFSDDNRIIISSLIILLNMYTSCLKKKQLLHIYFLSLLYLITRPLKEGEFQL